MPEISKCPIHTQLLTYWEALGEVSFNLLYTSYNGHNGAASFVQALKIQNLKYVLTKMYFQRLSLCKPRDHWAIHALLPVPLLSLIAPTPEIITST